MENQKIEKENLSNTFENVASLPTELTVWSKIKNVLFYEIKLELTPKQEKVFKEVNDFFHQDIKDVSFKGICSLFSFKNK